MDILNALKQLRDDFKLWTTNNLNALNAKIDEKTIPIDSELSTTSTNPVQNKAIKKAIDNIPTFSGDYNDLVNAPNIAEDGSGNMIIADESGNIIFKADTDGIHTTALSLNGDAVATEKYVDEAVANIDIPEVDFTGYATEDFVANAIDSVKEELGESITAEGDDWKIVDNDGNIIFSIDAEGAHTTSLTLNGETVEDIVGSRLASLVDSAPDTLNTLNELAAALGDDPNFATTIATEIGNKVDKVEGKGLSTNDFTDEYKSKLEGLENITFEETDPTVPAWAKAETKPTYTSAEVGLGNVDNTSDADKPVSTATQNAIDDLRTELSESIVSESNEWKIVDNAGNIIFSVDATGAHTTELTLNGESAATKKYVEDAIESIEFPTTDLTDYATKKYVDDAIDGIEIPEVSLDDYATKTYVNDKVADLVNSAPEALNTLGELAEALETHEDAYDALLETVGNKASKTELEDVKSELSESIESESEAFEIVDDKGNIITSIDNEGITTTKVATDVLLLDGEDVAEQIDKCISYEEQQLTDEQKKVARDNIGAPTLGANIPDGALLIYNAQTKQITNSGYTIDTLKQWVRDYVETYMSTEIVISNNNAGGETLDINADNYTEENGTLIIGG